MSLPYSRQLSMVLPMLVIGLVGGEPQEFRDQIVVRGDRLRGEVVGIEDGMVRFRVVYGEGELLIPVEDVEYSTRDGQLQPWPPTPLLPDESAAIEAPLTEGTNIVAQVEIAQTSPESIDAQIEETKELQETWLDLMPHRLGYGYFNDANDWLDDKLRLRLGLAYSALAMGATDSINYPQGGAAGDFDFFGRWRWWGVESGNTGTFGFNLRDRHQYTPVPPSLLGENLGSLWNLTSGFSDTGLELTQAYLDQYFLDRNVGFRIGQIFQDLHFDTYSYKSAKLFFLNAAFSDNPAVAFPEASVGFATLMRPVKDWHFITGVGDARGRKLDSGLQSLVSEKVFSGWEIGWTPSSGPLTGHSLAAFSWFSPAQSDSAGGDGSGLAVTYEWQPQRPLGVFARYSWSSSTATAVSHLGTAGLVWKEPWGRELDRAGVAFAWGTPSGREFTSVDPGFRAEPRGQGVLELFYRYQATSFLQVTPDAQLLINPSYNAQDDLIGVFSIRARVVL